MVDFTKARVMMVDTQVRPNDVTKYPVLEAMLSVPREEFVPDSRREVAYVGENVEIAPGRVLLEPRTLGKMIDLLDPGPTDLVMDLAAGTGYVSALLARMCEAVVAVEEDPKLATVAERVLGAEGADNVAVLTGALAAGAQAQGPFDAILVSGGAIDALPEAIVEQLKPGGRVVALFREGQLGVVRIGHRAQNGIDWRYGCNANAPLLPGVTAAPAFSL